MPSWLPFAALGVMGIGAVTAWYFGRKADKRDAETSGQAVDRAGLDAFEAKVKSKLPVTWEQRLKRKLVALKRRSDQLDRRGL